MSTDSSSPVTTHAGCILAALGLAALAIAMFGLRHALYEAAREVPNLPGLLISLTHLVQAMFRSAAATVDVASAAALIISGLYLMFRGAYRMR